MLDSFKVIQTSFFVDMISLLAVNDAKPHLEGRAGQLAPIFGTLGVS